jgi:hypothetical protein
MLATKSNRYTFQKDGIWYFSRRVPADLRRHYRTNKALNITRIFLSLCMVFFIKSGAAQAETQKDKNTELLLERFESYRILTRTAPSIMDYAVMNLERSLQGDWKEFINLKKVDGENIIPQAYYGHSVGVDGNISTAITMRLVSFTWKGEAKILTKGYAQEKCAKFIVTLRAIAEATFTDNTMGNPFLGFRAIGEKSEDYQNLNSNDLQKLIYLRGKVRWGDDEVLECGEFWK